ILCHFAQSCWATPVLRSPQVSTSILSAVVRTSACRLPDRPPTSRRRCADSDRGCRPSGDPAFGFQTGDGQQCDVVLGLQGDGQRGEVIDEFAGIQTNPARGEAGQIVLTE